MRLATMVYINSINPNEEFVLPGMTGDTTYICESRASGGGLTRITYRIKGTDLRFEFAKPGMTTAYLVQN